MKTKNNSAFTLMEMMVVVIILGIVAAFAIPNYRKSVQMAHEREVIEAFKLIHAANQLYFSQHDTYFLDGDASLNELNRGLNLNLVANNKNWHYSGVYDPFTAKYRYNLTVSWDQGWNFSSIVTNSNTAEDLAPCCDDGTCYVIPQC